MTFLELQTDIMESLGLTTPTARTRVKRLINKRLRQVQSGIRLSLTRRTVVSGTTTSGSSVMTVSGAKILDVYDKDTLKRTLGQVLIGEMRRMDAPQEVVGPPFTWAESLRGALVTIIELYPQPTSSDNYLFFDVLDNATDLVADGDEPAFPADFHDLLVDAVRYDELKKMEKMLPLAKEAKKQFDDRMGDLRYFIAKSAYLKVRQQDQFGEFGLTSRVWPYSNIGV